MKRVSFLLLFLFLISLSIKAQDAPKNRFFAIHEDRVHPSKVMEYEEANKNFVAILKKHNVQGADYMALTTDDFRYSFIAEISNFADLDKNPMAGLAELEGAENMKALWTAFDQCYDSHVDYIMVLDEEMSYMPEGMVINDSEQLYRDFQYWYIAPKNMSTMRELAMKYKQVNVEKGGKMPYRVYRSGFGTNENFYMFVASGKDPAEFEARRLANDEFLGEEAKNIYFQGLKYALRLEHITGWIRPDMSFMAEKVEAKKN